MAIVGDYTAQQMRNLVLKFYPGGYTPQTFGNVTLNWGLRTSHSDIGNLSAAITATGLYQNTTYTYLKYCENYVVGYGIYGVQILKGRCYYGGIRDLAASYAIWTKPVYSETKDLGAYVGRVFGKDLPAFIGVETPADLQAYVNTFQTDTSDLPASIHGWQTSDLAGQINAMIAAALSAYIVAVPPVDLPAYIKPWPMKQLPADIYGWGQLDLPAALYAMQKGDLPAYIGTVPPKDLGAILKGWVREAIKNLPATITGFTYDDLPASIRATYLKDLPAFLGAVPVQNLPAFIRGWQEVDLPASLVGVYGEYDLRASINSTNNYKNLIAYIRATQATAVSKDLPASIQGWYMSDINAYINSTPSANLTAYLNAIGQTADLRATIIPKTIRLTSVLDVITMAHSDLSAVINPSCIWSEFRDLTAYARAVYKGDLSATLIGKRYATTEVNLGAKLGYADTYTFMDKLPISIQIATQSYRYIDKLPILIKIFGAEQDLTATITGTYLYNNLLASITAVYLEPHHFDNTKNKDRVYNRTYSGIQQTLELIELSFSSIVKEYFYSGSGTTAWKTDRADKWILDIASYIPQNLAINLERKLHKFRSLYDLSRYADIDEAVRLAIDYVTSYPYDDISAYINPHGGYLNLSAMVSGRGITSTNDNLQATITGQATGEVVVGLSDDGVEIL